MSKHTAGPWKFLFGITPENAVIQDVREDSEGAGFKSKQVYIGNDKDECFADIKAYTTSGFFQNFDEWAANARLIAAAPEMYELLQKIFADGVTGYDQKINELLNKIGND